MLIPTRPASSYQHPDTTLLCAAVQLQHAQAWRLLLLRASAPAITPGLENAAPKARPKLPPIMGVGVAPGPTPPALPPALAVPRLEPLRVSAAGLAAAVPERELRSTDAHTSPCSSSPPPPPTATAQEGAAAAEEGEARPVLPRSPSGCVLLGAWRARMPPPSEADDRARRDVRTALVRGVPVWVGVLGEGERMGEAWGEEAADSMTLNSPPPPAGMVPVAVAPAADGCVCGEAGCDPVSEVRFARRAWCGRGSCDRTPPPREVVVWPGPLVGWPGARGPEAWLDVGLLVVVVVPVAEYRRSRRASRLAWEGGSVSAALGAWGAAAGWLLLGGGPGEGRPSLLGPVSTWVLLVLA